MREKVFRPISFSLHTEPVMNFEGRGIIFLDREGCINENDRSTGNPDLHLITKKELFFFRPGAKRAIGQLTKNGWRTVIVSNQEGIEKGLMSYEDLKEITYKMARAIHEAGGRVLKAYYCPHDPEIPCLCRKPSPAMLKLAAEELEIDLSKSWMVGDNPTDILAGKAAGCRTIHIPLNFCPEQDKTCEETDYVAEDLLDAVDIILNLERQIRFKRKDPIICPECNCNLIRKYGRTGCSNPNYIDYFYLGE